MENVNAVVAEHNKQDPNANAGDKNLPTNGQPNDKTAEPNQAPTAEGTPDSGLMKRVSEFHQKASPINKSEEEIDKGFFSDPDLRKKIAGIQDTELRSYFEQLRRSIITGGNQKFQDLSDLKKELESLKEKVGSSNGGDFYDVARQIKDPKWLARAKEIEAELAGSSDDDGELSPGVKKIIDNLQSEISELKAQNQQTMTRQQKEFKDSEHRRLQGVYSNYNPQQVDSVYLEMLEGKRQAVNAGSSVFEDIYRAMMHDNNVKNAYELGRIDERNGKPSAPPTIEGISTEPAQNIEPEKGESNQSFLNRIIKKNLAAATSKTSIQ